MHTCFMRAIISPVMADQVAEIEQVAGDADAGEFTGQINSDFLYKIWGIDSALTEKFLQLLSGSNIAHVFDSKKYSAGILFSFTHLRQRDQFLQKLKTEIHHIFTDFSELIQNLSRNLFQIEANGKSLSLDTPRVMGILNLTPDSFSDGGIFIKPEQALRQAEKMEGEGVDIFDLGAESTRPGAKKVDVEEEWQRIAPVIHELRRRTDKFISVDTYKSEIARRSIAAGADMINDISALTFDKKMSEIVASAKLPIILMHIKGTPENMQKNPGYRNVPEEIGLFLKTQADCARQAGIEQVIIDPGIGFGKRLQDNYEILRRLNEFKIFGMPLLMGLSRKSFLNLDGVTAPRDRGIGTEIMHSAALINSANILRVHDVAAAKYCKEIVSCYLDQKK